MEHWMGYAGLGMALGRIAEYERREAAGAEAWLRMMRGTGRRGVRLAVEPAAAVQPYAALLRRAS
jgi:hypothetical protein